jgi:RNA polymerase sigma-70 factor (ECF subfamily)
VVTFFAVIAHRAGKHVDARRPRSVVSATGGARSRCRRGQRRRRVEQAALRPVVGAERLVRFVTVGPRELDATLTVGRSVVN